LSDGTNERGEEAVATSSQDLLRAGDAQHISQSVGLIARGLASAAVR
jgi:hypothetical protein